MGKQSDRAQWLGDALEDETDIPKTVHRRVKVRNSDKIEVSPDKMTENVEKRSSVGWILLVAAVVAAAVIFAKWKGLF